MSDGREAATTQPTGGGFGVGFALIALVATSVAGLVLLGVDLLGSVQDGEEHDATASVGASAEGYDVWARNHDGTPVRWDPCSTIELVIDDTGAPPSWRADLARALDEVTEVTGIDFEVVGTTDERPELRRPAYQPDRYGDRWAPVLVAWSPPGEGDLPLATTDRGLAIPVAVGIDGDRTYITGQVVLNRDRDDLSLGFDDRAGSWGATLLHEFAHLLGLAHSEDPTQLMAPYPGSGPVEFGEGDRAGLQAVGRDAGCREAPEPSPVDVPEPRSELDLLREERRGG